MARWLVRLIRVYQCTLAAVLGGHCRFQPTCSQYAIEALQTHGLCRGLALAIKRVAKCHPWHVGGLDPVPRKAGQGDG